MSTLAIDLEGQPIALRVEPLAPLLLRWRQAATQTVMKGAPSNATTMPLPIDPRWPHEARLNPLDRPDRRWRCHAGILEGDHRGPGGRAA